MSPVRPPDAARARWVGVPLWVWWSLLALLGLLVSTPSRGSDAPQDVACPPSLAAPSPERVEQLRRQARDRGLLWRVTRDGHASHLYGTLHVGRVDWLVPGPRVAAALREADALALEIDITDPALPERMASAMRTRAQGMTLSASQRERLLRQARRVCLAADALSGMHPLMQAMTLALLDVRWVGLDPAFGQELMLAALARASARPVIGLETVEAQVQALVPDDPVLAERMFEQGLLELELGRGRTTIARLARVWDSGALAELEDYAAWCECVETDEDRRLLRRLNDDRNPAMAERIAALHGQGKRLFVAVGALHLTGPQGLPRLLEQRGFRVERVVFDR